VVATLVGARGSAPRPVGSRLAISERGELAGSVSGGCVESEVAELASEVLASGEARSVTYGISDEQAFSVGLPCGGRDRRSPRAGRARRPRAVPGREPIPPARVRRRRPRRGALQGGERAGLGDDRRRPAAAFATRERIPSTDEQLVESRKACPRTRSTGSRAPRASTSAPRRPPRPRSRSWPFAAAAPEAG
jgi:xanthine/CO dehydrogenase XdhC/CoxF family maturation factor